MRVLYLFLFLLLCSMNMVAQYSFELKVDYAMRVGNTDEFSLSGTIISGRIEKNKVYYLEDGNKVEVKNIISSKSATSVPVAAINENVSLAIVCKNMEPGRGDMIRGIATRPSFGQVFTPTNTKQLPEGILNCRINGKMYKAKMVSKPVYIKESNVLDMFFMAEDESVVWLQLNGFSEIETLPHNAKSDTSVKEHSLVCKIAFMPKGYRPTDMPNNYRAYEDVKGNAGIIVTSLNRYKKTIALEFSAILRPNKLLMQEGGVNGLFYISEGRVDNIGWDEF